MISVITLTFNNFSELCRTLDSVRAVAGIESLVINGGSCAQTTEFLRSQSFHAHVSEPDEGISDAFNKGARICKGDYVVYLNSGDTYIGGDYYDRADKLLNSNPQFDFVHSNILIRDRDGETLMKPVTRNLGVGLPALHPTMVIRKSVFEKIGYFSTQKKIAMDFDLVCRMTRANMQGYYLDNGPVVLMDGHGVSVTQARLAISEAFSSLKEQRLLTLSNRAGIFARLTYFYLASTLSKLGLQRTYAALKRSARRSR